MRSRGPFGGRAAAGAALAALVVLACSAGGVRFDGERYHGDGASWSIAAPPGLGTRWERIDVEGAVLAYRGLPGSPVADASLSLLHRCDRPLAPTRTLARHLLIGLDERAFVRDGAQPVAGADGWAQDLVARVGGDRVRLRTVTRVDGPCITDWVLVARTAVAEEEVGDFGVAASDFEAWWASFRAGQGEGPG